MRRTNLSDPSFGPECILGSGSLNDQRRALQGRSIGGLRVQKIELCLLVMESATGVHPSCRNWPARRQNLNLKMKEVPHIVRVVEPFCTRDTGHAADWGARPSTRPEWSSWPMSSWRAQVGFISRNKQSGTLCNWPLLTLFSCMIVRDVLAGARTKVCPHRNRIWELQVFQKVASKQNKGISKKFQQ